MIYYVYALVNSNGNYLYIGETKNPKLRYNLHVCKNGKFDKNNVKMEILFEFHNRKDAYEKQCELQIHYHLKTDKHKSKDSAKKVKNTSNRMHPKCIKTKILVYDVVTNELIGEFENQSKASKALNVSQTLISYVLLGKQKQSKKYRFEYKN